MGINAGVKHSPVVDAIDVGDYLVCFGRDVGDPLTNLKLQKLLYYAQGWFIAQNKRVLFGQTLRAWVRGPVVYEVWNKYRSYRWRPIAGNIRKPRLPPESEAHLAFVINQYWNYSAYQLEKMTHEESPWINARRGISKDTPSSAPISIMDMHDHFSKLAHGRKATIPNSSSGRKMA